jgi:class 3 adenylate cyclase
MVDDFERAHTAAAGAWVSREVVRWRLSMPTQPRPAIGAQVRLTVPATPEQLWSYVADTDRMDRSAGLPPVRFRQNLRRDGGETVSGEYRLFGLTFARWTEHPFEWVYPHRFAVHRDYQLGPLLHFHGGTELTPSAGGTQLRSFVEITPRYGWLAPLVRFGLLPVGLRRAARQHRAIGAYLAAAAPEPFPALASLRARANSAQVDSHVQRLIAAGTPSEPALQLGRLLNEGPDEDVAGMRPLELARRWGLAAQATLETFVRATVDGLVELRWEMLCPRCRGVKATAAHLRELAGGGFCPTCNLHFVADVDEAIEARFYPNPGIRNVQIGMYCVGSPAKTAHRLAQAELAPGSRCEWTLGLAPGRYELSSPQASHSMRLEVEPPTAADSRCLEVEWRPDGPRPSQATVVAQPVALRLSNAGDAPMTLALDDARFNELGTTPGRLMTLPAFHTFLSAEALAPGYELAIGRVGLLFTDLAGSTALYERMGDARAFKLVGQHFGLLSRPIEAGGGALIKTIGDAIMAAFPDGQSALAAALELQRAMLELDTAGVADPAHLLKVGVHAGSCYAVTLNGQLDYFGGAVNLAARAQNEARGGEVVLTEAVLQDCQRLLGDAALVASPFDVQLKGFSKPVRLYRIDLTGAA